MRYLAHAGLSIVARHERVIIKVVRALSLVATFPVSTSTFSIVSL